MNLLQKKEIYRYITSRGFENNTLPQAMFILSGGTEYNKKQGYHSPSYYEADFTGLTSGGKYRVIAAAEIARHFPEIKLVTTGKLATHGNQNKEHFPNDARVMADELLVLGVKENQIMLEEESTSTFGELVEMIKIAKQNNWKRISVLTSRWHVPRVTLMFEKLETIEGLCNQDETEMISELKRSGTRVSFISAEDITDIASQKYKDLTNKFEHSDNYQKRLELEQKGINDLLAGRYKVRR